MSSLLQSTEVTPENIRVHAGLEQILGRLQSVAQKKQGLCVAGLAGCTRGDGATFVSDALARDLAALSRKRVLQANCEDLMAASSLPSADIVGHCFFTDQSGRWRLTMPRARRGPKALMPDGDPRHAIRVLESHFDFVLLDCAAVTGQGWIWRVAPMLDDLFLVVADGETKREQVRYAQQLIAQSGARLSGCILNKRKYPLPGFVYRLMA